MVCSVCGEDTACEAITGAGRSFQICPQCTRAVMLVLQDRWATVLVNAIEALLYE